MMDCLQAQTLVSAAMDREPVEAALLAEAKEHCRTCPECAAFVSAQLAVRRAPLPEPRADLADRVMATVREEAQANQLAAAAASEAAATAAAEKAEREAARMPTLAPRKRSTRRLALPRPLAVGIAAAAMLAALAGAAVLIVFGARQMSTPVQQTAQFSTSASTQAEAPTPGNGASGKTSTGSAAGVPRTAAGATSGSSQDTTKVNPDSELITVSGVVYRYSGPSSLSVDTMQVAGSTNSALGGKAPATQRSVYTGMQANTVYVVDDTNQVIAFTKVTRTYLGIVYQLTSSELTNFAQWPSLPGSITAPTSTDGSPSFVYDGTDSGGVKVYRSTSAPVSSGIAIAPTSDTSGPGVGDPYWTWWTPAQ